MNAYITPGNTEAEISQSTEKEDITTKNYYINCFREEGISLEEFNNICNNFPSANIIMDAEHLYICLINETRENFFHLLDIVRLPQEKDNPLQIFYSTEKKHPKPYSLFNK